MLAETPVVKKSVRPSGPVTPANGAHHPESAPTAIATLPGREEMAALRAENLRLRVRVEELEQLLEASHSQAEQMWAEQQKEYEMLLEEKSEVIRAQHQQLQELRERRSDADQADDEDQAETQTLREQLLAMQAQLEEQQRRIEEDEQALMEQARQMEVAMSKERVEIARQRSELQRLHQDLQHEIEQAHRDGGLRERLLAMHAMQQQRGQNERQQARPTAPPTTARRALPTQAALPTGDDEPRPQRPSSGFLRRLFG